MERQVIELAMQGDSTALGDIYLSYKDDVYFYALKLAKNESTAEDIVQDTMIEMYKSISTLNHPEYFKTWLFRICHNVCYRYFTKDAKQLSYISIDDDDSYVSDIPDTDISSLPQEITEKRELQNAVNEMLDELPQNQREVAILFYYKDLPVSEITDILQCPSGTVKSNLNYARKKMRLKVEQYEAQHSVKLHSISIGPLIAWALRLTSETTKTPNYSAIYKNVCEATGVVASTAVIGTVAGTTVGITTSTKIIAGVAAAIILGGATLTGVQLSRNKNNHSIVAANSVVATSTNMDFDVSEYDSSEQTVSQKPKPSNGNTSFSSSSNLVYENSKTESVSSDTPTKAESSVTDSQESVSKDVSSIEANSTPKKTSSDEKNSSNTSSQVVAKTDEDGIQYFERANADYCYNDYGDYIVLTSYIGTKEVFEVPKSIDGIDVLEISDECFKNNGTIRKVTIVGYVDTIGNYAFKGCDSLETVTIGENVVAIGNEAFSGCEALTTVSFFNNECEFGEMIFAECPELTIYGPIESDIEYYCAENEYKFSEN